MTFETRLSLYIIIKCLINKSFNSSKLCVILKNKKRILTLYNVIKLFKQHYTI